MTAAILEMPRGEESHDAFVREMVEAARKDAREGHERLRDDLIAQEGRMNALESAYYDHRLAIESLKTTVAAPPDLSKVTMTPRFAIWLIGGAAAIVGSVVLSSWAVKLDVAHVSDQVAGVVTHQSDRERLDDERHDALMKQIDDLKKRQELSEIEIRNLSKGH